MDTEIGFLLVTCMFTIILRFYIFLVSIGITISIIFSLLACIAMFSAMIVSNFLGSASLAVIFTIFSIIFLLVALFSTATLHVFQNADQKLSNLCQAAYQKLEHKLFKHWKILLVMIFLRRAGLFAVCTNLDNFIWVCYAAFIDD